MYIYKQYDQAALNHQYNNRELVPGYQDYFDLWARLNVETQTSYTVFRDLEYGHLSAEKLDIYPSAKPKSPTMIFIHGGYWQMMDKTDFSFMAQAFVPRDLCTVIIGYPLAPVVTMGQIVESVRAAITWVHDHILDFGGDPNQIYLCGHSAGGHLATMMMTHPYHPPGITLRGICALSGLYDLIPIQRSHVNGPIDMSIETAIRCSPIQYQPITIPLILAVGGAESDEYHCQQKDLYDRWSPSNGHITPLVLPGVNHFSILSELLESESALGRAVFDMRLRKR